jgi:uncharacterized RDD family membrane protein YckC
MKKLIAILSLAFSVHGIFGMFYLYFFSFESVTKSIYWILYVIKPYYFSGLEADLIVERLGENSTRSINIFLFDLFIYLTLFVGSIIYIFSKFRETRLLSFNYSLVVAVSILRIIYIGINLKNPQDGYLIPLGLLLLCIVYIALSSYFIKYLNTDVHNTYIEASGDTENSYLDAASKSKRLLNFIIDTGLIITIAYSMIKSGLKFNVIGDFLTSLESAFGERFGALMYFSIFKFTYYFIFESVFQATPAKLLTRCRVTDEEGNKLSLRFLLNRTIFRFIPFESLFFLFGIRLHDKYSYSHVINQQKKSNSDRNYLIFLGIGFFLILVIYFYKTF